MAMGIVFLIGFAALAIAQDPATAPSPTTVSSVAQIEIQSPEDLALVVFMRSVFARTQGDARIARGYLSDKLFTDDELARLVAVSKDVAPLAAQLEAKPNWPTKQPTVSRDGRTVQIGFGGGPRLRDFLVGQLGERLFEKVRDHATTVVKMKQFPRSPR